MGALSGWIGWLGASIAGLTALCYGAGYFVIHTHLTMLGLSDVVDISTDQLLLEGGRFFYFTLARIVEAGMVIAVIATAICLIGVTIYKIPAVNRSRAVTRARDRVTDDRARRIASYALPLAVILLVVLHYNWYYDQLSSLLQLNNLAFTPRIVGDGRLADQVEPLIISGTQRGRDILVYTYSVLIWKYALFISIVWLVAYKGAQTAFGKAANILLILYAILLTALLPMAFGVLVRSPIYPAARLTLENGQQVRGLLLQRNEQDVLVWNSAGRRAGSYNREGLASIEVIGERDMFQKEDRQ